MRPESAVATYYARNMKDLTHINYTGDKATLGCIRKINVGNSVCSISISSDGDQVISGSSSGTYLWDVESGESRGPFGGDVSVFLSYFDNRVVIVNRDGVADEWDADTGERLHGLPKVDNGYVTSIAVQPLKYYATGSDGVIQLWDYRKRTTIGEPLRGHSGKVLILAFDKFKYQYLASGSEDQSIIVWDVERREMKYPPLKAHSGPITSLAFTDRSEILVSGSLDGTVRLWDVSSAEMLHAFSASGMGSVHSIATFESDDRHILSGSEDGIIRMWDTIYKEMPPKKFIGHTGKVTSLSAVYNDRGRRFASGSSDETIRIWDVERDHAIVVGEIHAIAVSPNGEYLVSGSDNGTVSVWKIQTGELIKSPLEGHSNTVMSVSFSPDGFHFASGSIDGNVIIWNLDGESVTCSGPGSSDDGKYKDNAVCFSPDGKQVASGSSNTIRIWDSKSGELVATTFKGHSDFINSVCYSPDGKRIVSGSWSKTIHIWDVSNGALLLALQGHPEVIISVTYSHDNSYILSGSYDGTIRVWDADNGRPVRDPIRAHEYGVSSVCFSPDDTYFVSGSYDKTVCAWNTSTRELLFKANVSSTVNSVVFLPSFDSKHINFASASLDGSIRIWCVGLDSKGKIWNAPDSDGWVIGSDGNLLYWLSSDIRPTLTGGTCVRILNSRLSTTITLSKYQGSQWASCFPSSNII